MDIWVEDERERTSKESTGTREAWRATKAIRVGNRDGRAEDRGYEKLAHDTSLGIMSQPTQCAYIGAGEGTLRSPSNPLLPTAPGRCCVMVQPVAVLEHSAGEVVLNAVGLNAVRTGPADGAPTVLRDNGAAPRAALLFVVSERPAFWLARSSDPARSVAAVTRRAEARAEDPRQRVDGGGRPCAAGRRGRPAFVLLPASGPATGASTSGPNRCGRRRFLRPGVEGAEPPASPMSDIGYAGS